MWQSKDEYDFFQVRAMQTWNTRAASLPGASGSRWCRPASEYYPSQVIFQQERSVSQEHSFSSLWGRNLWSSVLWECWFLKQKMAFLFIRLGFCFYSFARCLVLVPFSGAEALEQIHFLNKTVCLGFFFIFIFNTYDGTEIFLLRKTHVFLSADLFLTSAVIKTLPRHLLFTQ